MFKKMNRHIYISLMSTAALLVAVIITVSVVMVANIMTDNYIDMAVQKLDRSVSSSKNYINSVLLSAGNIASDSELIAELITPTGKTFTSTLDNACNYAMKTNAITVYSTDGRIFSSSNITQMPTLKMLETNDYLNDFFTAERNEDVSLRTDNIARFYDNAAYNEESGIISCCQKIYSGDMVIGYVVSDIFPSNVYKYFDYSGDEYFSGGFALVRFDGKYFPYGNNSAYVDDFINARFSRSRTSDGEYLIVPSARNFFGGTIGIAVSLSPLYVQILIIFALLAAFGAATALGAHFAAKFVARSVNKRLVRLHSRMEREGYGYEDKN